MNRKILSSTPSCKFSMLLVQNTLRYINTVTFESILGVFLFKTGTFQRIKK